MLASPQSANRLFKSSHGSYTFVFTADCYRLSMCRSRLWNTHDISRPVKEWNLGRVWPLKFSPDGKHLAVGTGAGLVFLLRVD